MAMRLSVTLTDDWRARQGWRSATVALLLAALLPFLCFFDSFRNVEMQGDILLLAGGFASVALILQRELRPKFGRLICALLLIFSVGLVMSTVVHRHLSYDVLGSPYQRLGLLGLLSCMVLGVLVRSLPARLVAIMLYSLMVGLAAAALPYSLLQSRNLQRIGGLFAQADVLACCMGCGLLLGLYVYRHAHGYRRLVLAGQLLLVIILLLTQTRAVLLLSLFLVPAVGLRGDHMSLRKVSLVILVLGAVILAIVALPTRMTNRSYAEQSVSYRLDLQKAGLGASLRKPWLGYGSGNLADALDCRRLQAPSLHKTCSEHYFFNSSHNIFLDRVLAVGWPGGLAFLCFTIACLSSGLRARNERYFFAMAALLIAGYYLTNVTNVPLELLFWVLLIQSLDANTILFDKA